jgi:PAS domain S-box-containing protein
LHILPAVRTGSEERSLLESIDLGFCIVEVLFDESGRATDYRFLDVNRAFARQTGLSDSVGRRMRELAPGHEDHWYQIYGQVAQTGVPVRFEQPAAALGRWFSAFAFRVDEPADRHVAIFFHDITNEKNAQRDLHASEARYRAFAHATSNTIYRLSADGSGLLEVYGGRRLPGLDGSLPIAEGMERYVHPDDRSDVAGVWMAAFASGTPYDAEHRVRLDDGSWQWVHSRAVPVRADDGRIVEWIGSVTDISERKKNEEELRRSEAAHLAARQEAEHANSAKDAFLAMVGHELRNPLAPMRMALDIMRKRGTPSREQDVLDRQLSHLTRLVDDLLDAARSAHGKVALQKRPMELCVAVSRAIETSAPTLERHRQELDVDVPHAGLVVDADVERLSQVISNLLTNAAKFSERGSRIRLHGARHGDGVRLSVKDGGIGIPAEMLEAIFEPFVQTQTTGQSREGLGLGLAIARNLIEAHGGTIRAFSDGPQHGSELVIELPALERAAADADVIGCSDEVIGPRESGEAGPQR